MKTVKLILRLKARKSEVSVIKNSLRRCPKNCDSELLKCIKKFFFKDVFLIRWCMVR